MARDTIDTLRDFTLGNVRVVTSTVYDNDADFSYLGEFSSDLPRGTKAYCYDRREGVMLLPGCYSNDTGAWRDEKGRIVASPESPSVYRRDSAYIHVEPREDVGVLKYAFQDAKRLDRLDAGDWYYLGIVCTVTIDGEEIGNASVWGLESDSGDAFLRAEARGIEQEALADARRWLNARVAVPA